MLINSIVPTEILASQCYISRRAGKLEAGDSDFDVDRRTVANQRGQFRFAAKWDSDIENRERAALAGDQTERLLGYLHDELDLLRSENHEAIAREQAALAKLVERPTQAPAAPPRRRT